MGKWLSKDPDAYLRDRPPVSRPYLERAREHALRRDGPPYARDWRDTAPPWSAVLGFTALWLVIAYVAAVVSGATASLDTLIILVPVALLGRSDAMRWGGAALNQHRDRPTRSGRPFGGAPWLVVFAAHLACVLTIAAAVGVATSDEASQRLALLASGFVAGAAGWLIDVIWGGRERADGLPAALTAPRR